ncbi:MAG: hypothetical protein Q7S20_13035 [Gemmatimonadaceae bacterium]|nr:hypothetical protein [Gemmatimonadaceae bacterium]
MTRESSQDAFERRYMAAFEALAAQHGIVVKYQRDRAARDIGLHLTKPDREGAETLTSSLVWFQMKGITAAVLTKETFASSNYVKL